MPSCAFLDIVYGALADDDEREEADESSEGGLERNRRDERF
jgi:hypothetical protein